MAIFFVPATRGDVISTRIDPSGTRCEKAPLAMNAPADGLLPSTGLNVIVPFSTGFPSSVTVPTTVARPPGPHPTRSKTHARRRTQAVLRRACVKKYRGTTGACLLDTRWRAFPT